MKKLCSIDLLSQETILSDLSKRDPPTPLIRGEKNYFPEGVLRSHRLSTLTNSRNTQLTPLNLPVSTENSFSSDFTHKTEISLEIKSRNLSPLGSRNGRPHRTESLKSKRRRRRLARQEMWLSSSADAAFVSPDANQQTQDFQEKSNAADIRDSDNLEIILPEYQHDIGKPTANDHAKSRKSKADHLKKTTSETLEAKANLQSKDKGFLDNYQYFTSSFPITKEDSENEKEEREKYRNEKEITKLKDRNFHNKLSEALKSLSESSKPTVCRRSSSDKENIEATDRGVLVEEKENRMNDIEPAKTEGVENHCALPALESKTESSAFQVYVRIRPLDDTGAEAATNRLRSLSVESPTKLLLCTRPSRSQENNGTKHHFTFSRVFPESSLQREVFEATTHSVVESVLLGHRGCIITYGTPSSGKSYTLYGKASSGKHRGIITRSMESILNYIHQEEKSGIKCKTFTSFLQIYNEKFYDLLDPSTSDSIKFHDSGDLTTVEGVTEICVQSMEDVSKQLRRSPNRMRDAGSRSHTVFTVRVCKEQPLNSPDVVEEHTKKQIKRTEGKLTFVDLVGVGRFIKHASFDSPAVCNAEAKTTKSLNVFANILNLLSTDRSAIVPFKECKLTRLLRNALGGDCITRLIFNASPCPNLAHETLTCLQLAQKSCSVINNPIAHVNIIAVEEPEEKSSPISDHQHQEPFSRSPSSSSKLPPINSHPGQHLSTLFLNSNDQLRRSDTSSGSISPSQGKQDSFLRKSSPAPAGQESSDRTGNLEAKSSVKLVSLSSDDPGIHLSPPDNLIYLQVQLKEPDHTMLSLPHLSSSKSGQVVTQPTSNASSNKSDKAEVSSKHSNGNRKLPSDRGKQQDSERGRRQKVPENKQRSLTINKSNQSLQSQQANFASTLVPAEDNLINGASASTNRLKKQSPLAKTSTVTASESPNAVEVQACCQNCRAREEKIKSDYDRMILFSKKDRDEKHVRIEELEKEVKELKGKTASIVQMKLMEEARLKDQVIKENQSKEIVRLEGVVESLKTKLSSMVSNSEVSALQDLRRKEHQSMDDLKTDIENLKLKLKENSDAHKRELFIKNDARKKLELEISNLRKLYQEKESILKDMKKKMEEKAATAVVEQQRIQTRNDTIIAELSNKVTAAMKDVARMQEAETKMMKERREEKETFLRELAAAKQTSAHTQADLKASQSKLIALEKGRRHARTPIVTPGPVSTPRLRSPSRRPVSRIDASTEMLSSPVPTSDGLCSRCRGCVSDDNAEIQRDEELRILLLQDARNREVLIQLKRERNLLCDVMKIMYCRHWFTEEGHLHIKRTLHRVGVDTKTLNTVGKKVHT